MTESNRVARLIYKAYVNPQPPVIDLEYDTFKEALELFADARERERKTQELEQWKADFEASLLPEPPPEPEPPPDTHTHTHTAGAIEGEGDPPAAFARGPAAKEKREVHARLTAFCVRHGAGARRKIAEASGGKLTPEDILSMQNCGKRPIDKWRAAAAAMDRIEEKEKE